MYITSFTVINPHMVLFWPLGQVVKSPVKDGQVTLATVMTATLSIDHRVIDGAVGQNGWRRLNLCRKSGNGAIWGITWLIIAIRKPMILS